MLFNSLSFLIFAIIVVPLFFLMRHKYRWLMLLVASCVFYGFYIPAYLLVLFTIITIDFFAAKQIQKAKPEHKKRFLIISLIGNLGILFFFKYFNFFIDNVNHLSVLFPFIKTRLQHWDIALPIGLSFHTFQAISYVVEVYRGKQEAENHYGIYALYVMFFPQLVAGPIERPQNMLHQFHEEKKFNFDNLYSGLRIVLWGLFLKSVIADRLAAPVDNVFNYPDQWHGLSVLLACMFFNIQVYCDFAGYSFIAIGIARTMGYKLMDNFKQPFFAGNIVEFWKRWHISLTSWFRDYVYIPLGGNQAGKFVRTRNAFIVFFLSGLWHGANYTFIAWGLFHAILLTTFVNIKKYTARIKISSFWCIALTFLFTSLARVFYRSQTMDTAIILAKKIFTFSPGYTQLYTSNDVHGLPGTLMGLPLGNFAFIFLLLPCFFFIERLIYKKKIQLLYTYPVYVRWGVYYLAIMTILFIGVFDTRQFIYFQF